MPKKIKHSNSGEPEVLSTHSGRVYGVCMNLPDCHAVFIPGHMTEIRLVNKIFQFNKIF